MNAILPFGAALTCAAMASSAADSAAVKRDLFEDAQRTAEPGYLSANPTIASFVELARRARIVAHSERDEHYVRAWLDDASAFSEETSQRYALAARLALAESAFLVAVWDGATAAPLGGTGHTVLEALDQLPVLWLDPADPQHLRRLVSKADLASSPIRLRDGVAALMETLQPPQ